MKPRNLISVFQGDAAIESIGLDINKQFAALKKHEIRNMQSFCSIMADNECLISHFDGFFVSYTIAQIGKELDLLRFGEEFLLNIEIKSELKVAQKEQKILKQMRENHYYLKFLGKSIRIFTYIENDGFYKYDVCNDSVQKISAKEVAQSMKEQTVNYSVDPDKEFIPSNYLISPFNATEHFIDGEYFLTSAQQRIKDEIKQELKICPFKFFCISANAGTGKTLLMYDIAKEQIELGQKVKIIQQHTLKFRKSKASPSLPLRWRFCSPAVTERNEPKSTAVLRTVSRHPSFSMWRLTWCGCVRHSPNGSRYWIPRSGSFISQRAVSTRCSLPMSVISTVSIPTAWCLTSCTPSRTASSLML